MNLNRFKEINLFNAGTSFFKQLNIRLNSNSTSSLPLKDILKDKFKSQEIFEKVSAAYFLGLVDKSVFDDEKISYEQADKKIHADYEGMMIFAVRIDGIDSPTRTQLADLTRAFNRASKSLPVVVLFRYGNFITLATSKRTKYKQTWREGEKIGKISLLKDIDILNPHTGHIKILNDLVLKPGVRDFNGLYQQWRDVFNVQLLNRNFYKELSSWYFWALRQVKFPDDAEKNKEIRNSTSVIRLITRLIFVWFLKEKRLVPKILFNKKALDEYLKYDDINSSTYYKAILQNLFFATLNTKMKKDDPESRKFVNRQYGVQAFYRHKKFFKDKKKALKLFEAIPFLNGGLFENLDKNIGKDNEIRIDCFSNRPVHEKKLKAPDCLFFGDKIEIDLSKELGSKKRKKETVRGLIHILNSYKFTIDENTPIEEEIALDPELLGKVFENLLASYNPETQTTARKQTGSFYTPREIVNYMVDESLKASLSSLVSKKIDNATEDDIKTGLDILFEYTEKEHAFTDNEVSKIVEAISELKILDPACGSGAFPMGILHKLVFILNKIDGDNKKWRELQKQRAVKETESAYNLGNKEGRHQRLKEIEEAFDFNTSDYGRKLFLIENSIYGVDIQPIAVQIAKLRFFISLIVDQNTDEDKENLGILPLPNLETKFVAANTLIGIDKKGQLELNFQNPEIDKKEKELAKVRERHFSARTPKTKEKYREKDESLRNEIASLLEKDGFASDVTKKLANWNPYDQNASADFFDTEWMFGLKSGFDIVIGNPPYIRQESIRNLKPLLKRAGYEVYNSTSDIYTYFYEKSYQILKPKGFSTFITSNKWMRAKYGENLREFFKNKTTLLNMINFGGYKVFEATVDTNILIFKKETPTSDHILNAVNIETDFTNDIELDVYSKKHHLSIVQKEIDSKCFSFADDAIMRLKAKIEAKGTLLKDWDVKIYRGILTGFNKAFIIDTATKERLIRKDSKSAEIIKPILRGRDIGRYYYEWAGLWIIAIPSGWTNQNKGKEKPELFFKNYFPAIYDYLKGIGNKVKNGEIKAKGKGLYKRDDQGNYWWELRDCDYYPEFKNEKIVYSDIGKRLSFVYEPSGKFLNNTGYFINNGNKYLLAFLNSRVTDFYYRQISSQLGNAALRAFTIYIEQFPIPNIPEAEQKPFITLVDQILSLKKSDPQADTSALEAKIDRMVYKLYGLSSEEIGIIEKV
jgi:hypothetical protein